MHENLKYTLRLNEEIKAFRGFHLDTNHPNYKAEIGDWQAIYSDTKYGTHFFIYAKFIGKQTNTGFHVEDIQLYLQNYKGAVSISFGQMINIESEPIFESDPDNDSRYPNRIKHHLYFTLKGLSMDKPVQEHKPKELIINHGDVLIAKSIFTPANPNISNIYNQKKHSTTSFVDELFMARLGEDVFFHDEGLDRLSELFELNQVTEEDLINAGLNPNKITKSKTNMDFAIFGKRYPCIPIYSFCSCY